MDDLRAVLEALRQIAESMVVAGAGDAARQTAYYRAAHLIDELADYNQSHNASDKAYVFENLSEAKHHLACCAGLEDSGGHDLDQHQVWVVAAINSVRRELKIPA